MSLNKEAIKRDFMFLFDRISKSKNASPADIEGCMRKLAGFESPGIPEMIAIEQDVINMVRNNTKNESTVLEVQDYLRKIRNTSIFDPKKLIYFLKEMSPFSKDGTGNTTLHMKPFLSVARSMDNIRTSTPITHSQSTLEKPLGSDYSSFRTSGGPIKSVTLSENNSAKLNKLHISGDSRPNSSIMSTRMNKASHNYRVSNELTEHAIIGDLLYVIIGCNGQYFSWNTNLIRLELSANVTISNSKHCLISKLAKIGMAFNKIREYVNRCFTNSSTGVVCQGFCAAINEHLASYNSLVSVLHSKYNAWTAALEGGDYQEDSVNKLTMQQIVLWLHDPGETLVFIMTIVDNVSTKKGGELASAIYKYLLNGASNHQKLSRHLLLSAVEPIFQFIDQWIYDGVLNESHQEFFVAVNNHYNAFDIWTNKYALRPSMIPSFISLSDAEKILLAGKSINFLREICQEKAIFKNRREFSKLKQVTAESMIDQDIDRSFERMIATVYAETSKNLLEVMFTKYQLMDHLKALRKYLLQGQGDFILRLIELIGPELSKPGSELVANHMGGQLYEALKTTNAQYDSNQILDRIGIKMLPVSSNELGWDIFSLEYHISTERPLMAVVNTDSFKCYVRAFMSLFRSRRVHFILNSFFKKQHSSRRLLSTLPKEVTRLVHFSQTIIMEMLHFVNQIQYYINFEVLESSWKKFTEAVSKATDLNQVIDYHQSFLKQIIQRCLLEPESRDLLANLRTIYDLIIDFESIINDMFALFQSELRHRAQYQEQVIQQRRQGQWGVDDACEKREQERMLVFTSHDVCNYQYKLKGHYTQYESQVVRFMSTLIDHHDPSLQCLYTHLDFNNQYKDRIRDYRRSKVVMMASSSINNASL